MTDITGFALLGHALEMAAQSEARLRFSVDQVPFLSGAKDYADQWLFPGGTFNNQKAYESLVSLDGVEDEMTALLFTPETSGGLLIAVPPAEADRLEDLCREAGQMVWRVGEAVEGAGIEVVL